MAVDIRAKFMSNLGTVISGSVSDNPMLDAGLVTTTGEITVVGNVQRPRGHQIELAYGEIGSSGKITTVTRFPRRLRVLSCTADPFRNTTTFQIGDKLTLASSLKSDTDVYYAGENKPDWWDDQEFSEDGWWYSSDVDSKRFCKQRIKKEIKSRYSDFTWNWEYDRIRKVVPTIQAWPLIKYICGRINIQLNIDSPGFHKNRFQFLEPYVKFDNGYLQVLDDLIVSEACYGYLNMSEQLTIVKYPLEVGRSAPVMREADVIDIQTITTADNPDESLRVNYSAKQRKKIAGRTLSNYTDQEPPD